MILLISFFSGIIFSFGLSISGMINPEKVIGFLTIFGDWNYSIAFFVLGITLFNFITFKLILRQKPILHLDFSIPKNNFITRKLAVGSILFGIGWGLIGLCPGPGLVNLVTMKSEAFIFVGSMLSGMILYKLVLVRTPLLK